MARIKIQLDNRDDYTLEINSRHHAHKFTIPVEPHILPRFVDILDGDGYPLEIDDEMDQEFAAQLLEFGVNILLIAAANYEVKDRLMRRVLSPNQE